MILFPTVSCAGISRQQVIAGKIGFSPKIDAVGKAIPARGKILVTALREQHPGTHPDRPERKVCQSDTIPLPVDDRIMQAAIGAVEKAQRAEPIIGCNASHDIDPDDILFDRDNAAFPLVTVQAELALAVTEFGPACRRRQRYDRLVQKGGRAQHFDRKSLARLHNLPEFSANQSRWLDVGLLPVGQ